jgi:hypothetical protein
MIPRALLDEAEREQIRLIIATVAMHAMLKYASYTATEAEHIARSAFVLADALVDRGKAERQDANEVRPGYSPYVPNKDIPF